MLISHRLRLIFIKGVKVAGTSFEVAMNEYADVATPLRFGEFDTHVPDGFKVKNAYDFAEHSSPEWIRDRVRPYVWQTYTKLTIVRNPWDIAVSKFYWYRTQPLERLCRQNPMEYARGVNRVLRFENLQEDFDQLRKDLGLDPKPLPLFKDKTRSQITYRDFFHDKSKERDLVKQYSSEYCSVYGYNY